MLYTTIAIIYNPRSTGSSKTVAQSFKKRILARLPKQKVELFATEYAQHAEELAYSIAKASRNPLIISSSGDGGYNEVVNGAIHAQKEGSTVTTGLLPAGNANDHYHALHDTDTVGLIIKNKRQKIDLLKIVGTSDGEAIERYAHSYIGFGFTPQVGEKLTKTKLNIFKEMWLVTRALIAAKPVQLKVGKESQYYESIIFSNIDKMSKFLKVSRPASITDGKFEVTLSKQPHRLQFILVLLKASVSGISEDRQVSRFTLDTIDKTLVQTDGEILTLDAQTKVTISIEKQALRCIV